MNDFDSSLFRVWELSHLYESVEDVPVDAFLELYRYAFWCSSVLCESSIQNDALNKSAEICSQIVSMVDTAMQSIRFSSLNSAYLTYSVLRAEYCDEPKKPLYQICADLQITKNTFYNHRKLGTSLVLNLLSHYLDSLC